MVYLLQETSQWKSFSLVLCVGILHLGFQLTEILLITLALFHFFFFFSSVLFFLDAAFGVEVSRRFFFFFFFPSFLT